MVFSFVFPFPPVTDFPFIVARSAPPEGRVLSLCPGGHADGCPSDPSILDISNSSGNKVPDTERAERDGFRNAREWVWR